MSRDNLEPVEAPMRQETILTAAKRIVRFINIDNEAHGGLLSRDTIQAADILRMQIMHEERTPNANSIPAPK